MVSEKWEVGRQGHPAITQLLVCVSDYMRKATVRKKMTAKIGGDSY